MEECTLQMKAKVVILNPSGLPITLHLLLNQQTAILNNQEYSIIYFNGFYFHNNFESRFNIPTPINLQFKPSKLGELLEAAQDYMAGSATPLSAHIRSPFSNKNNPLPMTKPPNQVVFSPYKPSTSMSATPQIQSKKTMRKRVQDVRELSVKKSLLAQEAFMNINSSGAQQQSFTKQRLSAFDNVRHISSLVKDYQTRSIVNQMTVINDQKQYDAKPRQSRTAPYSEQKRVPSFRNSSEVLGIIPPFKGLEEQQQQQQSFFDKFKSMFNKSKVDEAPPFIDELQETQQQFSVKLNECSYSKFTCTCERTQGILYCCSTAYQWLSKNGQVNERMLLKMQDQYRKLTQCEELSNYEEQIMKDLARTFPRCPQFKEDDGLQSLRRVLLAYSRYDQSIGYVQGMNFIVGALLYHCSEEIAFWIFVSLIEDYDMRDIYEQNLPGLYKRCFIIKKLVESNHPKLQEHFDTYGIIVEMYASEWVFCLFASIVPITQFHLILNEFMKNGWTYFYRLSIAMLTHFKDKLLEEEDIAGILYHIKFKSPEKRDSSKQLAPQFLLDDATGQLVKLPSPDVSEQKLFSKLFGLLTGKRSSEGDSDTEASYEYVWKQIVALSLNTKIEQSQIRLLTNQYLAEENSTGSRSSGGEEVTNSTPVRL